MHTQLLAALVTASVLVGTHSLSADDPEPLTYRRFTVEEREGRIVGTQPVPDEQPPLWARDVSQETADWSGGPDPSVPYFAEPIPFVIPPADAGEPFHPHNHQPSVTWLPNGDLLAIWYSTGEESGTELTVIASRLRAGGDAWDPSSEFFKAPNRNMHGSSLFHDGNGTVSHFNGMGPDGGTGWAKLALLMRTSRDNGVTWTAPRAIGPEVKGRHQVISGTILTSDGVLIQNCDAVSGPHGGTALHLSRDGGKTWSDPGAGKPAPEFTQDGIGEGTIAGIHAKVVELNDGRLMALGRGDSIEEMMPMSLSDDQGRTWTYRASPFPPIGGGQRLVLRRLEEGPLLFISFTSGNRREPEANPMTFRDQEGNEFTGHGMYAALSFDEGETWPVRKLLTPGEGEFDGGAHTGPFTATPTRAEHAGYLAATQTPDRVIHLISSRLHYRFNLAWLTAGTQFARQPLEGDLNSFLGEPRLEMQQVFKNERFPNVVVALDGTVLATWGNKSLRVRRSEDGGASWGEEITIADPGFQGGGTTVDETTGDILAFVEEKHPPAPLTIYRSRDQGRTWQPQDETVIHPDSRGHLPSMHMNEHGITLRHGPPRAVRSELPLQGASQGGAEAPREPREGPHQGRLLRPTRYYAGGNRRDEWPNHYTNAMYSDDGGLTWQTSEPFPEKGTGEAALVELSDGRIYYNSRVHWDERPDNTRRRAAWSDDGGRTWTDWHVVDVLPDGHQHRSYGCMGGLTRLPVAATGGLLGAAAPPPVARGSESSSPTPQGAGRDILIFSNIDTPNPTRERATVWASFDGGKTWPVKRLVYEGRSAYSSLNAGRPGTPSEGWIYLFFEGGPKGGGTIARFNLSWLLGGEATGDGQIPDELRR